MEAILNTIKEKVSNGGAVGSTIKFSCGDAGSIFIDANTAPPSVSMEDLEADCTIICDQEVLSDLVAGELDPTAAFMGGKLRVEGDMSVAMKLSSIL